MGQSLEAHIRKLQDSYWSDADPDGRGFVPLADALRRAGDLMEAHRILRDGLRRHPDYVAGQIVYAWLSMDRQEPEEAESRFRAALELDPRNIVALRGLGEILLGRGEDAAALPVLEMLLGEEPTDQGLPRRIRELRGRLETSVEEGHDSESAFEGAVWDDPSAAAEELDWDEAALQRDSAPPPSEDSSADPPRAEIVVEDGESLPGEGALEDALLTPTLGEIYLRQGLLGQAEKVFVNLMNRDPANEHLRRRLEEVRSLMDVQGREPAAFAREPEADEMEASPPLFRPEVEESPILEEGEQVGPGQGEPATHFEVVPIESLAPDRKPRLAVMDGPVERSVLSGSAQSAQEGVPPGRLSPDGPVPIESLAPDGPVPIESLAPGGPVPIESLAPGGPVAIESLAPDEVSTATPPDEEPPEDPTLDTFERWLDNLQ